jgi:hypothetical protein
MTSVLSHVCTDQLTLQLNNLLDLKVKQATVFEAQLSRMAALDTARQGQTILVFTIVTIIFVSQGIWENQESS